MRAKKISEICTSGKSDARGPAMFRRQAASNAIFRAETDGEISRPTDSSAAACRCSSFVVVCSLLFAHCYLTSFACCNENTIGKNSQLMEMSVIFYLFTLHPRL